MHDRSPDEARSFIQQARFIWHQRFELAPGVPSPGVNDMSYLLQVAAVPDDLSGLSVLDIGSTNGAIAFEAERRGAARVVAVDILDPSTFGFHELREFFGSKAEHRRASVYALSSALDGETFDVVFFWGVLYHLRHPLLALDEVRAVSRDRTYVETAVADWELDPHLRQQPVARFYRRDELAGDPSNWFAPTTVLLGEWLTSAGFDVEHLDSWGPDGAAATRAHASCVARPGQPEWRDISYEVPVRATVQLP